MSLGTLFFVSRFLEIGYLNEALGMKISSRRRELTGDGGAHSVPVLFCRHGTWDSRL